MGGRARMRRGAALRPNGAPGSGTGGTATSLQATHSQRCRAGRGSLAQVVASLSVCFLSLCVPFLSVTNIICMPVPDIAWDRNALGFAGSKGFTLRWRSFSFQSYVSSCQSSSSASSSFQSCGLGAGRWGSSGRGPRHVVTTARWPSRPCSALSMPVDGLNRTQPLAVRAQPTNGRWLTLSSSRSLIGLLNLDTGTAATVHAATSTARETPLI